MARVCGRWTGVGLVLAVSCYAVLADKNEHNKVSHLCDRKISQRLYRTVDGAVVVSNNEDNLNLDCVFTFQTDSVLQKFMLRFEELQLDCNDHLYIYDGAHVYGSYQADLSCGNNHHEVGTIYTRTNFVTFRYVTDGWGQVGNGFRLVLTAYKDTPLECRGFRCANNLCIHNDLTCDLVDHCGDNSDESPQAFCYHDGVVIRIFGLRIGAFIVIMVVCFIVCFLIVAGLAVLIYKWQRRRPPSHGQLNTIPPYPYHESNHLLGTNSPRSTIRQANSSPHHGLQYDSHGNEPTQMQPGYHQSGLPEKPPPYPGNLYPPQEGIGYSVHQGNIYYQTK